MINPLNLANEWRDSLLVTILISAAAATWSWQVVDVCFTVLMIRQITRDLRWTFAPPPQIVGGAAMPRHRDVADWGGLTGAVAALCGIGVGGSSTLGCGIWLFLLMLNSSHVLIVHGSLRPLWRAGVASWDWPRKKGGPTETQKLADWAALIGQSFHQTAGAPA